MNSIVITISNLLIAQTTEYDAMRQNFVYMIIEISLKDQSRLIVFVIVVVIVIVKEG